MIIHSGAPGGGRIEKRISLRTRAGEGVSLNVSLADDRGRQSAAEYLRHLYNTIKNKLNEPVIAVGPGAAGHESREELARLIVFIAAFHDSMFGTFNRRSELPEKERNEFVELFLLACATVLEGSDILIDLGRGRIVDAAGLS